MDTGELTTPGRALTRSSSWPQLATELRGAFSRLQEFPRTWSPTSQPPNSKCSTECTPLNAERLRTNANSVEHGTFDPCLLWLLIRSTWVDDDGLPWLLAAGLGVAVALGPVLGEELVSRFLVDAMELEATHTETGELRFCMDAVGPGNLFRAKKAKTPSSK